MLGKNANKGDEGDIGMVYKTCTKHANMGNNPEVKVWHAYIIDKSKGDMSLLSLW